MTENEYLKAVILFYGCQFGKARYILPQLSLFSGQNPNFLSWPSKSLGLQALFPDPTSSSLLLPCALMLHSDWASSLSLNTPCSVSFFYTINRAEPPSGFLPCFPSIALLHNCNLSCLQISSQLWLPSLRIHLWPMDSSRGGLTRFTPSIISSLSMEL